MRLMEISKLEVIQRSFDSLLKRAFSIGQKSQMLDAFTLEVALLTFKSAFLQQKVVGLKILTEVVRKMKANTFIHLTLEQFRDWLATHRIYENIFDRDTHDQLVKVSGELLRFLFEKDLVTEMQLELCFGLYEHASQSANKELAQSIYKALYDIPTVFHAKHALKIIELIARQVRHFCHQEQIYPFFLYIK